MPNAAAEAKKAEGNNFFKRGDYDNAIKLYSQAIEIDPSNHAYWSNRSASYAGLGQYEQAAEDGMQCIRVNKQFIKGYFRAATAQQNLGQNDAALQTVKAGLAIDSSNADLKRMQKELEEAVRVKKVQVLVKQAQEELECSDFGKCLRTVDQGLRLDAGNADLERIKAQAEPRFERQEKSRKAGLSRTELLKEEGDTKYKAAQFEEAIDKYSKCLDAIGNSESELAIKCFLNRSACYKQLSNFDGVISDCTMVLEVDPNNVKSLVRRAQAFEACERYRYALQDVRTVLQMPMDQVGSANYQLANGMQHRLNRVVQQLKNN